MERRRPYLVPVDDLPPPRGIYRDRMDGVLDRVERVRAELAAVRETAGSADGAVVATVDGAGALTGLRFGPRATALPPERLAEQVLAVVADAASAATNRAARLVDGLTTG
ncbi:YbaB/EbfC family nucleoid-associated protein [Pseudonocardia endophytica]|uniref:DNA-binding protein YbaB n=1 Tax=Pseudonocardia endophytica TaxID=401976 RepID=A0A4R1HZE5_PSEEN|nr:YbaB/EbfC family nucleoid-associated protein [Pseudonocardia endophytica]TCK27798.1 DNA-binding protein YbaB [Pseudonocardia endophytica]